MQLEEVRAIKYRAGSTSCSLEITARLGFKAGGNKRVKEPWWLRRIKSKIQQLRKDISRLEKHMSGEIRKSKISDQLKRKYKIDVKGPSVLLEELKQ